MTKLKRSWGYACELVSETGLYTVATLGILPGEMLKRHYHRKTSEIEIVLQGHPRVNGELSQRRDVFCWEPGVEHEYDNRLGKEEVVILCISFPDFDPEDELFV